MIILSRECYCKRGDQKYLGYLLIIALNLRIFPYIPDHKNIHLLENIYAKSANKSSPRNRLRHPLFLLSWPSGLWCLGYSFRIFRELSCTRQPLSSIIGVILCLRVKLLDEFVPGICAVVSIFTPRTQRFEITALPVSCLWQLTLVWPVIRPTKVLSFNLLSRSSLTFHRVGCSPLTSLGFSITFNLYPSFITIFPSWNRNY